MQFPIDRLSLVGCLGVCSYLSYLCFTSPNPAPPKPYEKDRLMSGYGAPGYRKALGVSAFAWHLAFILFPEYRSNMCLNPDLFNPALNQWSWYTGTFVGVVLVSASIRLQAYARLGKSFTFVLAKPDKLITTGIYSYVQHPSYTGLMILNSAWYWTFMRLDGISACFLPSWIVSIKALNLAPCFLMTVATILGLRLRLRDEEEMLRKEFGKEWEDWHAKTKRFIPWVV